MSASLPEKLTPSWFGETLGWRVDALSEEIFYRKDVFNSVARVHFESRDPRVPPRAILKRTFPPAPVDQRQDAVDPCEFVREYYAYQELPALGVNTARVFYSAIEPVTERNLILMEDLILSRRILPVDYVWQVGEMQSILKTYARLHAAGFRAGQGKTLQERFPWLLAQESFLGPARFARAAGVIFASPVTAPRLADRKETFSALLDLAGPLRQYLSAQPETFNYNDFFPGNIAVPGETGADQPAALFDWHLLGTGIPQADLLNVLWGWSLNNETVRDECLRFYLDRLNAEAGTTFDLTWAKEGMLVSLIVDIYQSLARLSEMLPEIERGASRLPGWLENQLKEIENGQVDRLLQQGQSVVGDLKRGLSG